MTHLAKILAAGNVLLDLQVPGKREAFECLSDLLAQSGQVSRAVVLDNLLAREALASTGLGRGVAVPHGRIKGLKSAMAAFVRLKEPVPFDSPDGEPVRLMICLLIPDNVTQQHLEILSEVAEMFSNDAFRAVLATESDAAMVHARILAWKPGRQATAA